ncbi:MAG: hypothetical protein M0Q38_15270 [Bacteroidales bacterium]|jgi:uncharacterized protein (TIGR02145 family)|nr:hypothetical protein [Bacteroidales bacterium]
MKKLSFFIVILLLFSSALFAQVAINTDGALSDPAAMLDIQSTTKGLLPPRMTYDQMYAITSPPAGLTVFCTDCGSNGLGAMALFINGTWYLFNTTCLNPIPTTAGVHVPSPTQIIWNWNTLPGAAGYKWNTTNDYASALDMGTSTTKTETGLTPGTLYTRYVWVYNSCGFSTPVTLIQATSSSFTCGDIVSYEGKSYNTVQIGTQCWFKENLNVGTRINRSQYQLDNDIIEKYCYNDSESNCDVYGGLYQWNEAMQYVNIEGTKGICPSGWHIPMYNEWAMLVTFLGGEGIAGGKMKEAGTAHWWEPNAGATNSSGFTGLPAGYLINYNFYTLTTYTSFWSSLAFNPQTSWIWGLSTDGAWVDRYYNYKTMGMSVRCLKD